MPGREWEEMIGEKEWFIVTLNHTNFLFLNYEVSRLIVPKCSETHIMKRQIVGIQGVVVPKMPPPSTMKPFTLKIKNKINSTIFGKTYRFFVD